MERVNKSTKLKAFHHFLLGKEIVFLPNSNYSEMDEQFIKILSAIQINDKTAFEEVYSRKSKSNPTKESPTPFVNDDYLIFCLIIAITKFDIDRTWINSILSIRNRNPTTITLENILHENYSSTNNQAEVVLIYLHLCHQAIDNDLLNTAYKSITENMILLDNRNDFLILCACRAYDLIIEQKEASYGSEITLLKKFNQSFTIRIKILSWIVQYAVLLGLIYGLLKLPAYSPEVIQVLDKYNYVFTLLGALGVTFLGNLFPFSRKKSKELLMRLLGYPTGLLNNKEKEE